MSTPNILLPKQQPEMTGLESKERLATPGSFQGLKLSMRISANTGQNQYTTIIMFMKELVCLLTLLLLLLYYSHLHLESIYCFQFIYLTETVTLTFDISL
jgi:hypothetical protein